MDQNNQKIVNIPARGQNFKALSGNFDQEYELTNLSLFTTYDLKIRARTSAGSGPFSPPAMITTLEGVPDEAPRNLEVIPSWERNILVKFDPIPEENVNGRLLGYKVKYFKNEGQLIWIQLKE